LPSEGGKPASPFHRLMIAQDTGSAILGPARADLYWGAGDDAGRLAGRIRHSGRFVMLLPRELDMIAAGQTMPLPLPKPHSPAAVATATPATVTTAKLETAVPLPLPKPKFEEHEAEKSAKPATAKQHENVRQRRVWRWQAGPPRYWSSW
jgi:membrane-bound lytic murein transglycosylase A